MTFLRKYAKCALSRISAHAKPRRKTNCQFLRVGWDSVGIQDERCFLEVHGLWVGATEPRRQALDCGRSCRPPSEPLGHRASQGSVVSALSAVPLWDGLRVRGSCWGAPPVKPDRSRGHARRPLRVVGGSGAPQVHPPSVSARAPRSIDGGDKWNEITDQLQGAGGAGRLAVRRRASGRVCFLSP